MWSKHAASDAAARSNNKQATSLKSKISHRKRKGGDKAESKSGDTKGKQLKTPNNKSSSGKKGGADSEGANEVKKGVTPDLIEDLLNEESATAVEQYIAPVFNDDDELDGVVLRKKDTDNNDINSAIKRYSDSYVIDNSAVTEGELKLLRAHSGYLFNNSESEAFVKEKKSRRFSDLFRPNSNSGSEKQPKSSSKMVTQFEIADDGRVAEVKESPQRSGKSGKIQNQKTNKTKAPELVTASKKDEAHNSSVLKRVRSKIYKQKNESIVSAAPKMPDISEKKEKKTKGKEETKKPTSHFEYRMFRQTSNLEAIRPGLGHKKTLSVDGSVNEIVDEKPVLAKSKSSSAINLNLLRRRRLLLGAKTTKVAKEFDYISFNSAIHNNNNISDSNTSLNKSVQVQRKFGSQDLTSNITSTPIRRCSWITGTATSGEAKPGNPLTRTPSDRRPDAVREESCRTQPLNQSTDNDNDSANPESSTSQPASTGNKRRQIGNINRSESVKEQPEKNRKQRRNVSDPLRTTGSEAVDLDNSISFHQHSGSSSNSSLSSRSLDSPSSSLDVGGLSDGQGGERDSDMEVEADPPDWKSALTNEQLSNLQANEMKRQDVINELFHTERSHVRNLKVLDLIFRREMVRSKILTDSEMKLVFPNLPELLGTHIQFNLLMKTKRKEQSVVTDVGDILLNMFDGERGTSFRNAAAKFCEQQQSALELIKEKRKKDAKFENLLMNCEKNHHCRRLPLQGFLPQEMQRLSKYPLLLGRIIEQEEAACVANPERSNAELEKLKKALEKSREILKEVDDAAKKASETARLSYINCHLEISGFDRSDIEYKHIDLTKYTFVYEGTVTLKRPNKNPLQVHMLLTEEAVILLQKEGQSYLLKFFHCGNQSNQTLSPIIKMQNLICRPNAADTVTLYLVSNNTLISHMYEIQCRDVNDRKTWLKYFTDASEQYKMRTERTQESEEEPELPASTSERPETMEEEEIESSTPSPEPTSVEESKQQMRAEDTAIPAVHSAGGEGVSVKLIPNEWPLIQPSEVQVANPPVHTAEPVLTPLEQIKRKDTEVKQALAAKEGLVADLLSIPRDEYRMIADIVSEEVVKKESSQRDLPELVLAAVFQVDQLLEVVNDSLNVSEADSVLAAGGKHPACASNEVQTAATALAASTKSLVPSVPSSRLHSIATTLNSQLTILLSAVKGVEEDRENLRKELHRTREQLHEKCSLHGPVIDDDSTQLDSTQSGDLESIEESPTETETT